MMVKAWDIVGYTYQAETLCPGCTLEAVRRTYPLDYPLTHTVQATDTTENILRTVAKSLRLASRSAAGVEGEAAEHYRETRADFSTLDPSDEHTYDSDDFPKVVFASSVEGDERCDSCGGELI